MTTFTATIGGESVSRVLDVRYSGQNADELGTAEIDVENTPENRNYSYGEVVRILRDGTQEFEGVLTAKPQGPSRGLTVTLTARDRRQILDDAEVHRPFYNVDSGQAIREAIEFKSDPQEPVEIFTGGDLSGFSSTAPKFGLADLPNAGLTEIGSDLLYVHFGADETGEFSITYDDVPTSVDGDLLFFETRTLFNDVGDYFSVEVELRDHSGTNYVWDLPLSVVSSPERRRLPVQEADPDGDLDADGTLQYRISIDGLLPESRAGVIDFARVKMFSPAERGGQLQVGSVEDSGRTIIRRFDSTLLQMIQQLSVEDGANSYVEGDSLNYVQQGDEPAPAEIRYGSTRVLDVSIDRDSADIVNKVVAQGAGDLQRTYQNSASVNFYGEVPKEEPLVDESIQTEQELTDFAEGYLSANAWEDTAVEFVVFEEVFRDVRVGQQILVDWSPGGIGPREFRVSNTETDGAGRITLGLTGHTDT